MKQSDRLVDPTLLFRFSVPVLQTTFLPNSSNWKLGVEYVLPSFSELAGKAAFAEIRMAWSLRGLFFQAEVARKVAGKEKRQSTNDGGHGLSIWIDTHNSPDVHRASRYCHCFRFTPGKAKPQPVNASGKMEFIPRAKDNPIFVESSDLSVRAEWTDGGYRIFAAIRSDQLTGYDPNEFSEMGFYYQVVDEELGLQTLAVGDEMKYQEDTTLWARIKLEK